MIKNFTVIESFTHYIPTGLGWIEGLDQLGHNVYAIPTSQYDYSTMSLEDIDWTIFMGTPDLQKLSQFKQLNPDTKVIVVCFGWNDIYLDLRKYVDIWIEHTYKHDLVDSEFEKHGIKLNHIPLGASSKVFSPLEINKTYDLSFVGQFGEKGHGYRHQDYYLYPLMGLNLNGFYSGFGKYNPVQHEFLNQIYNQSKINLNFHYQSQKEQSTDMSTSIDFNGRVFEIALAGGFQLCDHPNVNEYFGDEIIYSSKEDWLDTFNYYLNNPDLRKELSLKAHQKALANHTWKSRMSDLIKLL
jgi:hypothetical protein